MTLDLFVRDRQTHASFIVAPQSGANGWWAGAPAPQLRAVPDLIAALSKRYSIEPRRVYIGGQSVGGYATYGIVAERPELSAFVFCGGGDTSKAARRARVPFWIFTAPPIASSMSPRRMRCAMRSGKRVASRATPNFAARGIRSGRTS